MANVTVSSAVDTMLQSANNAAIRSNIGAIPADFSGTFTGDVEFDGEVIFNGQIDASNASSFEVDEFTVNGTAEFQDTVEFSSGDVEFTAGGGQSLIMGSGAISGAASIEATSFIKVSPITTTARNALSASNGMIIYNSTDNKFQAYENGAWVNLI
jgi:hypothetical protein